MRSLRHYLTESVRTYRYTIKIAGDCDKKFLDEFKYNLTKFDPVQIDDPKTTPIQKNPYGFPDLENESITIIKAEFKYPATEPMIQQLAQLLGCNLNRVRVMTTDYNDSINDESDGYANEMKDQPLLLQAQLEDNGKEASKEYANQYLDRVVPKKPSIDIPYEGQKTPTAPNKSKEGINTQSPMSKMTRPMRPETGSRKASN
jgi:hypothetical protein